MKTYAVTIDIPAGISSGQDFGEDLAAASDRFGDARRGTYPNGTKVTLWENNEAIDWATITEDTKAAARAEAMSILDDIVAKANARTWR